MIGPFVFALFAAPLQDIIKNHGIQCMTYTQMIHKYTSFSSIMKGHLLFILLQSCVSDIKLWSASNGMKLNDDKTEILHFTNKFTMCPQIDSVFLGSSTIATVETARNLGVTMDRFLTMSKHVSNICKAACFALRKIGTLRQFLSQAATENLVHALIMPRIDFCNSLLYSLSDTQISKLQRIQNSAARLVKCTSVRQPISPILQELHWLPVKQRIKFKILLLIFQCLSGTAPSYLQ